MYTYVVLIHVLFFLCFLTDDEIVRYSNYLLPQVSKDRLRPYVGRLVEVLLECFKDDSWPVRDGETRGMNTALLCVLPLIAITSFHMQLHA